MSVRGPLTLNVTFGPSTSPSFQLAVHHARRAGGQEVAPNRWRAVFLLTHEDPRPFGQAARLLELVRDWRSTTVEVDEDPEARIQVAIMLQCARDFLRTWGRCGWRYHYEIPGKCVVCPLFDRERAVREIGEPSWPADVEVPDYPPEGL